MAVRTTLLLVFPLFWVLTIWGLIDGDLYAKEAAILGAIWLAAILCFAFVPIPWVTYVGIGVTVILDVILVVKVVGNPTIS